MDAVQVSGYDGVCVDLLSRLRPLPWTSVDGLPQTLWPQDHHEGLQPRTDPLQRLRFISGWWVGLFYEYELLRFAPGFLLMGVMRTVWYWNKFTAGYHCGKMLISSMCGQIFESGQGLSKSWAIGKGDERFWVAISSVQAFRTVLIFFIR